MSDRRQFLYHTLIFGFGGMLAQLVPVILFPLYTNYLPASDYGVLDLLYRVGYIVTTVLMVNGIRLAIFTFYRQAENEEKRRRVAITISLLVWISIVISITISYVFSERISEFLEIGDSRLLAFGLATMFIETLTSIPMALLQIRLESVRYVLTNLTMLLVRLILCVYLVAWLEMGIWGILISQFTVSLVFGVVLIVREFIRYPAWPDYSQLGPIFKFAWPFLPIGLLGFTSTNLDRFFLLKFGPYTDSEAALAAVGLYALAFRLTSFARVFGAVPMQKVWAARMYDIHKQADAVFVFGNFALRIFFVQIFFILGICVFAPEAVTTICDRSYLDAASIVPIAGINATVLVFIVQLESIFYITRKTHLKLINQIILLPTTALFMYILVPAYGIMGATIAFTGANICNCVVLYLVTQRLFPVRYPFKRFAILILISLLCYYCSTLFGSGVEPSNLTPEEFKEMTKWDKLHDAFSRVSYIPLLWKSFCIIAWCGMVWISGALLKDDKEMVVRNLGKVRNKFFKGRKKSLLEDEQT